MDPEIICNHLALAEPHVPEREGYLAPQRALICELQWDGPSTEEAWQYLRSLAEEALHLVDRADRGGARARGKGRVEQAANWENTGHS
jgi:hypothetical protein